MKVLIFDVTAPYGHFRVPYTVTSPLTLPVPSKTALYGMLAAIVGLDKKTYLSSFQNKTCQCAIQLLSPIKKTYIAENYLHTKNVKLFARMDSKKASPHKPIKPPHSQIKVEFLKDPAFRLYIHMKDQDMFSLLGTFLAEHKSAYTLSMGLSQCIANFDFIGAFEPEILKNSHEFQNIASIVPISLVPSADRISFIEENKKFIKIHIPLEMKPDRQLIESGDFLVEANGHAISARLDEFLRINELNTNILMF